MLECSHLSLPEDEMDWRISSQILSQYTNQLPANGTRKSLICHGLRRIRYKRLYIYLKSTIKQTPISVSINFLFGQKCCLKYDWTKIICILNMSSFTKIIIKCKVHIIKTYLEWDYYKWMLIVNINLILI